MTARVLRRVRLNRSIAVNWPFRCNIAARSLISWQLPPAPVIFQKGPNDTNSIYVYRVRRARSRGLIIFHHPTKCVRSKPPRDLCSSSFVRRERNRFEVGTIRERGDEATPPFCSLSSFFPSFETRFLSPYSHHLFLSCFQRIYMYIYTHTHSSIIHWPTILHDRLHAARQINTLLQSLHGTIIIATRAIIHDDVPR